MHIDHSHTAPAADEITFNEFLKIDIRIGTIVAADEFPEARNPAYKLQIDFGETIGVKKSCAQVVTNYPIDELPGR